jgi:hypothetical protein
MGFKGLSLNIIKVKLKLSLVSWRRMGHCRYCSWSPDGGESSVSGPGRFLPRDTARSTHWYETGRSPEPVWTMWRENVLPLPGNEPRSFSQIFVDRPIDRLCGLVVRVPGYRSRGPGSIPGTTRFSEKQWVWNGVHSASWVQFRSYLEENIAAPV